MDDQTPPPAPPAERLRAWVRATALAREGARLGLRAAVDVLYPPGCVACGRALAQAHALCPPCWRAAPWIERPYCERLGAPFPVDMGPGAISLAAAGDPPVFARARAAMRHDAVGRELAHRLKYGDRMDLAPMMGRWMARAGRELLADGPVIAPVPLHWTRLWRRRMNQAGALAAAVAQESGAELAPDALERRRRTRSQVGLTRNERAENLQGAFAVTEAGKLAIKGRRVLLVDDVYTTGSTANAASRALLRGGAEAVDVLTFARVCLPA
ncbi:amidophosphoribosyltransferase [Alsobacter metallidurans]|uniref:Amidophosphoribosyltransferase n=1 Tax=Alsobacter metallidurans TaxID=340221 RepID=A0A917MLX0_9HYPH|nr:ComF family protein [Alsobacter metallidurans]GGH32687.1 amidophosphoribosyltransferase [Alsobacter metallidurans]